MIDPVDLKELLKAHRWTLNAWTSGNQQVFSAKRRQGKKLITRYIGTSNKLMNNLTEESILAKLNCSTSPALTKPASSRDEKPRITTANQKRSRS